MGFGPGVVGAPPPPLKEGGGAGKGAPVAGQSQEARPKTLMMTHHLRCKAARKRFVSKNVPHDTYLKVISASWGIILSHLCWGTSGPPPPSPNLLCRPVGVPVTRALKGGGGSGKRGSNEPPPPSPPRHANLLSSTPGVDIIVMVIFWWWGIWAGDDKMTIMKLPFVICCAGMCNGCRVAVHVEPLIALAP